MLAQVLTQVKQMPFEERIIFIQDNLDRFAAPDDRAYLGLYLVHAYRGAKRPVDAVEAANRVLSAGMSSEFRWWILGMRALVEIERADDLAAAATVAEMDGLTPRQSWLGEYYGIRARIEAFQGSHHTAFDWFSRAIDAFNTNGFPQDAVSIATWAALHAVDSGLPAERWLEHIPVADPYRLEIEADLACQSGDRQRAAELAERVLAERNGDSNVGARALYVLASLAMSGNRVRGLWLAEQALTQAVACSEGVNLGLVSRIQTLISACEREVG